MSEELEQERVKLESQAYRIIAMIEQAQQQLRGLNERIGLLTREAQKTETPAAGEGGG